MRPSTLKLMPEFLQTLFNQTRSLLTLKDPFQIQSRKVRFPPTSFFFFFYSYPSSRQENRKLDYFTKKNENCIKVWKRNFEKIVLKNVSNLQKEVGKKICFCKLNNIDDNRRMLIDYRSGDEKIVSEKQKGKKCWDDTERFTKDMTW